MSHNTRRAAGQWQADSSTHQNLAPHTQQDCGKELPRHGFLGADHLLEVIHSLSLPLSLQIENKDGGSLGGAKVTLAPLSGPPLGQEEVNKQL